MSKIVPSTLRKKIENEFKPSPRTDNTRNISLFELCIQHNCFNVCVISNFILEIGNMPGDPPERGRITSYNQNTSANQTPEDIIPQRLSPIDRIEIRGA
jgi:hypothetical protein